MRHVLTPALCLGLLFSSTASLLAAPGPKFDTQKEDKTIPRPGQAGTVKLKVTHHGKLERGDHAFTEAQSKTFAGAYWDRWTLDANRGVDYTVILNNPRHECVIIVTDDKGKVLKIQYSKQWVGQRIENMASTWFTAPRSGKIHIYVTTSAAARSGEYTLWVQETNDIPTVVH